MVLASLQSKRYLVVTYWGYPFGGGEAFMYQSMKWATEAKMNSYWLCFCGADNKPYPQFSIVECPYGTLIKVPGGFSPRNLETWLYLLKPDLVHHQGHRRIEMLKVCMKLKIPFVSGFHFWHGGVELKEPWSNQLILENAEHHKKHEEFDFVYENAQNVYLASEYMQQVFEKICNIHLPYIIHPISDKLQVTYPYNIHPIQSKFLCQVNIHKHKGGELFLQLAKEFPDISFLAVRTELFSDELDALIKTEMQEHKAPSVYMERVEDVKLIYRTCKVCLVPSLCDETFCRVALEAMMNGIPVITTGRGNIKNIVGIPECIIEYENVEQYKSIIHRLFHDDAYYLELSKKTLDQVEIFNESIVSARFTNLLENTITKTYKKNIMIMVPWCDQGLGIQGREYMKMLESCGYTVFIFSFLPYWNVKEKDRHQKNPKEWEHPRIYYSDYTREEVKDYEIIEYVNANKIGVAIIPETCWPRIFQVAHLLKSLGVRTIAVPNIEIVRRDEMHLHGYFDTILCNNYICKTTFENHGFTNCSYIGYSLPETENQKKKAESKYKYKFMFLGGMNAFTRKQVVEVCQSFDMATKLLPPDSIHLTACIQGKYDDRMDAFLDHPYITIKKTHLSYNDIQDLYFNSDINIQVSKHEGLGLGFYESISKGVPCLTVQAAPHNEIIVHGKNGWVIPCTFKPMLDNNCGFMESAYFENQDLANMIVSICQSETETNLLIEQTKPYSTKAYNYHEYKARWVNILG